MAARGRRDAILDEYAYGYDRLGNPAWKENVVAGNLGTPVHLDELYAYDERIRGQLLTPDTFVSRGAGCPRRESGGLPVVGIMERGSQRFAPAFACRTPDGDEGIWLKYHLRCLLVTAGAGTLEDRDNTLNAFDGRVAASHG